MSSICEDCRKDLKTERMLYGCACNPDVFFCLTCSINGQCFKCFHPLQYITTKTCDQCFKKIIPTNELNCGHKSYCLECVRKAYLLEKGKAKITIRKYSEPIDKLFVYSFLKCFCWECDRKIHDMEDLSKQQIVQILPLNKNICENCQTKAVLKESRNNIKQNGKKRQGRQEEPVLDKQSSQKNKEAYPSSNSRAYEEDRLYCTACGRRAYYDPIVSNDFVLCSTCAKFSKMQEDYLSRESNGIRKRNVWVKDQEKERERAETPPRKSNIYEDQVKNSRIQSQTSDKNGIKKSQIRNGLKSSIKSKTNNNEEKSAVNIELKIDEPIKDNQLVECVRCGYPMEGIYSIWNQFTDGVFPVCRGCYVVLTGTCQPNRQYLNRLNEQNGNPQNTEKEEQQRILRSQYSPQKNGKGKNKQSEMTKNKKQSKVQDFPVIVEEQNYVQPNKSIYNSRVIDEDQVEDLLPQFSKYTNNQKGTNAKNTNLKRQQRPKPTTLKKRESAAQNFPQIQEEEKYNEPSRSIYNSRAIREDDIQDLLPQFSQSANKNEKANNKNENAKKEDRKANNQQAEQKRNGKTVLQHNQVGQNININVKRPQNQVQKRKRLEDKILERLNQQKQKQKNMKQEEDNDSFLNLPKTQKSNVYEQQSERVRKNSNRKENPYQGIDQKNIHTNSNEQKKKHGQNFTNMNHTGKNQQRYPYKHAYTGQSNDSTSPSGWQSYTNNHNKFRRKGDQDSYGRRQQTRNNRDSERERFFNTGGQYSNAFDFDHQFSQFSPRSSRFSDTSSRFNDFGRSSQARNVYQRQKKCNACFRKIYTETENSYIVNGQQICQFCYSDMQDKKSFNCGFCHKRYSDSQRINQINGVRVCLECFGEYNLRKKQKYGGI